MQHPHSKIQQDGKNTCRMTIPAAAKAPDVFLHAFKTSSLVDGVTVVFEVFLLTSSSTGCPSVNSLASGRPTSVNSKTFSKKLQLKCKENDQRVRVPCQSHNLPNPKLHSYTLKVQSTSLRYLKGLAKLALNMKSFYM